MGRVILHADMDAFYASVEQLDDPELRGRPVVVGGPAEGRGVVAAASYEARAFGVRSAMPMSRALRLCPELVRVSPRFDRYGELSGRIMEIFRSVTPLVEPLSLDEAFLDATEQAASYGGAEGLGRWLKDAVKSATGLTVSIGGGASKTVAKIASDAGKPDGLVVVPAEDEAEFLAPLPVRALFGVGPKAEQSLHAAGVRTIGDVARTDVGVLERAVGASRGEFLQLMARGLDDRPVVTEHERKSVGAETTFARDLPDGAELREELARIAESVARRLAAHGSKGRVVVLKLRYGNFRTITRQTKRAEATDDASEIAATASALLSKVVEEGDRFRLLGIHCTGLEEAGEQGQLGLGLAAPDANSGGEAVAGGERREVES
ncbi:MAG: DNA polymerase IV [Dehalococcoidia bacterium]